MCVCFGFFPVEKESAKTFNVYMRGFCSYFPVIKKKKKKKSLITMITKKGQDLGPSQVGGSLHTCLQRG